MISSTYEVWTTQGKITTTTETERLQAMPGRARTLEAIAARDPDDPDRFVAALVSPALQFAVSARYEPPAVLNEKILKENYNEVYIDLNSASDPASRIVIEADPSLAPDDVVLDPPPATCANGHAVLIRRSKFVTLRGLTITGATGAGVVLLGGSQQNQSIHIERSRIFANGTSNCPAGGITVALGNSETVIVNTLIHGNSGNGIGFSVVAQPGEDQPVREFVEHQRALHRLAARLALAVAELIPVDVRAPRVDVLIHQTAREGEIIELLHAGIGRVEGALVNPAAYSHTSRAIADAIRAVPYPVIEVHLSNIHAREPWRRRSVTAEAARGIVAGFGATSYIAALHALRAIVEA